MNLCRSHMDVTQGHSSSWQGSQGYRQLEQLVPSGYITPTIRRWRLNSAAAQMAFCVLYSPASPAQGMVLLTVKMSIPISIDIINMNPHRHAPRPISQVILNSVKLTINTSSHNNQIHNAFIFSWWCANHLHWMKKLKDEMIKNNNRHNRHSNTELLHNRKLCKVWHIG